MPCCYIVGYVGITPIYCGEKSGDVRMPTNSKKVHVVPLCFLHEAFYFDANINGLFLNGRYRDMKEVNAIVKNAVYEGKNHGQQVNHSSILHKDGQHHPNGRQVDGGKEEEGIK